MKSITLPHPTGDNSTSKKTKRITTEVLQSLTTLWFLCTKQAITASRKLKDNSKISPDSPVRQRPKKLIATISNKAIKMRNRKKKDHKDDGSPEFGDDGLWQREILMGDKCQSLDFSGVINYNRAGPSPKITKKKKKKKKKIGPVPDKKFGPDSQIFI
ncbi:hypothetical protein Hanom_Chr12g01117771 [Helianthus anomalus]